MPPHYSVRYETTTTMTPPWNLLPRRNYCPAGGDGVPRADAGEIRDPFNQTTTIAFGSTQAVIPLQPLLRCHDCLAATIALPQPSPSRNHHATASIGPTNHFPAADGVLRGGVFEHVR